MLVLVRVSLSRINKSESDSHIGCDSHISRDSVSSGQKFSKITVVIRTCMLCLKTDNAHSKKYSFLTPDVDLMQYILYIYIIRYIHFIVMCIVLTPDVSCQFPNKMFILYL
jgi:hypothetical protein